MLLLSSAVFFQNLIFLKISFRNIIRVSSSLDSDQGQHSGSKLFAKDISRGRQKMPLAKKELTLKAPIKTAADDKVFNIFPYF